MELHDRDVRELGALLGDVLADQTSTAAFDLVETVRTAAIGYRRPRAPPRGLSRF